MTWVARCKVLGTEIDLDLSPKFKYIQDCQDFIDKNLQVLEYLIQHVQIFYDGMKGQFCIHFGNYIRCYCIEQKRFCTSFDF